MKRQLFYLSFIFTLLVISINKLYSQDGIKVFNEVLFFDGYNTLEKLSEEMGQAPQGILRLSTSLYSAKLSGEQLSMIKEYITMNVTVKAACDNYDRIGNVNIAFVPKGSDTYVYDDVNRIEIARFITPFMNKNKQPDEVPYTYNLDYLKYVFNNKQLWEKYDFWIELNIFGVPYAANKEVAGCDGRNDVFYGSLEFVTSGEPVSVMDDCVVLPLFFKNAFNNYKEGATDEIGKTVKSINFSLNKNLSDAYLVLITSNHGANTKGEEYNRRWHYVYFDNEKVLEYMPGRQSCEPFRKYNTQANGIYGRSPMTDEKWQSFSNWCPGDVIDNRIIELGTLNVGNHDFKIEVPDAVFYGKDGNFPLSLFLLGKENGSLPIEEVQSTEGVFVSSSLSYSHYHVNSNTAISRIFVTDITGKKIITSAFSDIDLSPYSSGVYIITVLLEDGFMHTQKVIKR